MPLIEDKEIIVSSPLQTFRDAAQNTGDWFRNAAQNTGDWFRNAAQNIRKDIRKKINDYYRNEKQDEINRRLRKQQKNNPRPLPCNDNYSGLSIKSRKK